MAINRISNPVATATPPTSVTGYEAQNNVLEGLALRTGDPTPIDGTNIRKGSMFYIQGVWYRADSTTAITGTQSKYVKIAASGATATASFVSSLSGVTWDEDYNGWYDASNNLYVFDEGLAEIDGEITSAITPNGKVRGIVVEDIIKCSDYDTSDTSNKIAYTTTATTDQTFSIQYPCFITFRSDAVSGHDGSNRYEMQLFLTNKGSSVIVYDTTGNNTITQTTDTTGQNFIYAFPGDYRIDIQQTGSPSPANTDISIEVRSVFGTTDYLKVVV